MTNSSEAHRVLEEMTIFNEDTSALFYDGRAKMNDKNLGATIGIAVIIAIAWVIYTTI